MYVANRDNNLAFTKLHSLQTLSFWLAYVAKMQILGFKTVVHKLSCLQYPFIIQSMLLIVTNYDITSVVIWQYMNKIDLT